MFFLERDSSLLHRVTVFIANLWLQGYDPSHLAQLQQYDTVMYASHSIVPFTVKLDPKPVLVHGGSHWGSFVMDGRVARCFLNVTQSPCLPIEKYLCKGESVIMPTPTNVVPHVYIGSPHVLLLL